MQVESRTSPRSSLLAAASFLSIGVGAGFVAGLLIGGVGGRLAMFVLRLTSDPSLHGLSTDDDFTIGIVSGQTMFLLAATAIVGTVGGVLYLVARHWVPHGSRGWGSALFFGSIGAAFAIRPHGVDFTLLSPLPLAIAMFIALPAAYGLALSWTIERFLARSSTPRSGAVIGGLLPLVPLALLGGIGVFIALAAVAAWAIGRSSPAIVAAWNSTVTTWVGRIALFAVTARAVVEVVRDTVEIL